MNHEQVALEVLLLGITITGLRVYLDNSYWTPNFSLKLMYKNVRLVHELLLTDTSKCHDGSSEIKLLIKYNKAL